MNKYLAELLGTFALVFCGTGAIVIDQQSGGAVTHAGIAITFGLIVMAMIYTLGNISGAHLNPAVTIAFTLAKRFHIKQVLPYITAQLAGAILASLALKYLFPANETLGATLPAGSEMQSFILEFILTFFLMLVIINVATGSKEQGMFAGLAIGSTVLFAGNVCRPGMWSKYESCKIHSTSLNKRALGAALALYSCNRYRSCLAIPVWKFLNHNK